MSDEKSAPPVVAGEPVAWRYRFNGNWYFCDNEQFARLGRDAEPLYAAPPVVAGEDLELAAARFHLDEAQARIAALEEALLDLMDDVSCYEVTLDVYQAARAALKGGET